MIFFICLTVYCLVFINLDGAHAFSGLSSSSSIIRSKCAVASKSSNWRLFESSYLDSLAPEEDDDDDDKKEDKDESGRDNKNMDYLDTLSSVEEDTTTESSADAKELTKDVNTTISDEDKQENDRLLKKILIVASATNRGQSASSSQHSQLKSLISHLKSSSGEGSIDGTWDLLYSNTQLFRSSPFFMSGRAACQNDEQAKRYDLFCDLHRRSLMISQIGNVRQIIANNTVTNQFEVVAGTVPFLRKFTPFSYSGGLPFTIDGTIVSTASMTPVSNATDASYELYMNTVQIKGSNVPFLRSVLDSSFAKFQTRKLDRLLNRTKNYKTPKPIVEIVYIDDDFRVSKDQDGNVFLYAKGNSNNGTDYNKVKADFGIGKVIHGFRKSMSS